MLPSHHLKSLPDSPVRASRPTIGEGIHSNVRGTRSFVRNCCRGGVTRLLPILSVSSLPAQSSLQPCAVRASGSFLPARRAHLPGASSAPGLSFHTANVRLSSVHGEHDDALWFSKVRIMSLASRTLERFRSRLTRFVEKERVRIGCAKTAMKEVARKLGMSTVNVYRSMNGYGSVTIHAHMYMALIMASIKAPSMPRRKRSRHWSEPASIILTVRN